MSTKTFWENRVVRVIRGVKVSFYKRCTGSTYTMDFKFNKCRVRDATYEPTVADAEVVAERRIKAMQMERQEAELLEMVQGLKSAATAGVVKKAARTVMLDELGRVYLAHVPPERLADYKKNYARLCAIATRTTGLPVEKIEVTEATFSRANLTAWVRMTQEHFRRGWTVRGEEPEDAWQQLRAELKSGRLAAETAWPKVEGAELLKILRKGVFPGVDKTTVMECNTTIQTYLRCAKAVFANGREYLVGLELPDLREFLSFTVDVAAPEGHRAIPDEVLARLVADLPRLAREAPRVYAFSQVLSWMAGRPGIVKKLRGDALQLLTDGTGVITLPAAKGGNEVRIAVGAECVQAVLAVRTADSLIGARHETDAARIDEAHRAWMTNHGVTGTLKNYLFRHMRLNQIRNVFDPRTAAEAGGHTSEAMVNRKYTRNEKIIPLVVPVTTLKSA
jgi:integrase